MTHSIRRARLGDAALLPAIEQSAGESFRDVPGLGWIADDQVMPGEHHEGLIEDGTSWVAVDDGDAPIGFVSAERLGRSLHIWEASVRHDLQGAGLGRRLFDTAIDWARDAGLEAVTLTTFRDLPWNERFYTSMGFVTFDAGESGARLEAVLGDEVSHGLPGDRRCAMRLALGTAASDEMERSAVL